MNRDGGVTFNFDSAVVKRNFTTELQKTQMKLDAQILADSNYYCPLKTGVLQKSAIINTVLGSGLIVWKTPYARKQYYGVKLDHSKGANPNACAKWFEAAKARKAKQWERLANDSVGNR